MDEIDFKSGSESAIASDTTASRVGTDEGISSGAFSTATLGRREAARMFGVALRTWSQWEREGRVYGSRWAPAPLGKPGRCKVYAVEDLARFQEEFRRLVEPYPDPDRAGCYRVPLATRTCRREAIIDVDSLPVLQGRRCHWQEHSDGSGGHVVIADGKNTKLTRIILGVQGHEQRVSHVNGDALDCRRENLVVRTSAQQVRAARKRRTEGGRECTSKFKGVSWQEGKQRWIAQIRKDGKQRYLGCFWDEIAAAKTYDRAARQAFGEHVRLNFPDDGVSPREIDSEPRCVDSSPVKSAPRECGLDEIDLDPGVPFAPGTVSRKEAARMFDVSLTTWTTWESERRVQCGQWALMPSGGQRKFYVVEELIRLREEFRRLVQPYPDPNQPGCYRVPLASQVHRLEAIIDAEDLPLVEGRNWNWDPCDDGHRGGGVVILASVSQPNTPMRRIITGVMGFESRVSHRNGDPFDCRRANLVVRTCSEQLYATRKKGILSGREYTSRHKGVCWDKRREKWVAQVKKEGKHRYLGRFGSETTAAEVYDNAARELFGEHAHLNFPENISDTALARAA